MSIWRWAHLLPDTPATARITLGEGNTPLVRSLRIGPAAGLKNLFFKLESANPSGSYKDRFAAAGIAQMLATGRRRCLATSSGNTGAALAAFSAAAGLECIVVVIESAVTEKLIQMLVHGAQVHRVRGFGLDARTSQAVFDLLAERGQAGENQLLISAFCTSPVAMTGVQTISYELHEQAAESGTRVDHVFCPAGGGGLTLAVARGFFALRDAGASQSTPAVHCVQPIGNDTIAGPLRRGENAAHAVACTSQISGLQVPSVLDGNDVIAACRQSGGTGHVVADEEIWAAQKQLAREEGIFCEPAAAAGLAGALRAAREGDLPASDTVVCLITGAGWKDAESAKRMLPASSSSEMTDLAGLERLLGTAQC